MPNQTNFRVVFGSDWDTLKKNLSEFEKDYREALYVNFRTLGLRTVGLIRKELKPVRVSGKLQNSVSFEISMDSPATLEIGPRLEIAPHAKYIYYGTKPHWAPIAPLKEWARIKLGDESAAWAIQKSIAKKGTSTWAARKYGTKGDNPYLDRVISSKSFNAAVEGFKRRMGIDLIYSLSN